MAAAGDDPMEGPRLEAAAWRIRLTEENAKTSPAFETWRAEGRNAEAWGEVQALWLALDDVQAHPKVRAYRLSAKRRGRHDRCGPVVAMGLLAATLAVVLVDVARSGRLNAWETYSAPGAARRMLLLEDGTRVTLDASSRLRVRLTLGEREIELEQGQARFDVAHDRRRPFRVHAEGQVATALGTSFTVDRTRAAVTVTLLEGRVAVSKDQALWRRALPQAPAATTYLNPGQRVSVASAAAAPPRVEPVSLVRATAWEGGHLDFDGEPLDSALERLSRYSAAPIVVGDAETAALRVSGIFEAGDAGAFVAAVSQYFDLEVARGAHGKTILRKRRENSP